MSLLYIISYYPVKKQYSQGDVPEKVIQLLDKIPDYKTGYVLAYVQSITVNKEANDIFYESLLHSYLNDKEANKHDLIPVKSLQGKRTLPYNAILDIY